MRLLKRWQKIIKHNGKSSIKLVSHKRLLSLEKKSSHLINRTNICYQIHKGEMIVL